MGLPEQPSLIEQWEELNNIDSAMKIPFFTLAMGFVAGIVLLTGFDITPEGTIQYAAGAIFQAFASLPGGGYLILVWDLIVIVLAIAGIVAAYVQVMKIISYGPGGIAAAATGFLAGFLVLVFSGNPWIGYAFVGLFLVSLVSAALAQS